MQYFFMQNYTFSRIKQVCYHIFSRIKLVICYTFSRIKTIYNVNPNPTLKGTALISEFS